MRYFLQAYLDLAMCINKDQAILHNLCAAPIMYHVEHDPSILIEFDKGLESVENIDYLKVCETIYNFYDYLFFSQI